MQRLPLVAAIFLLCCSYLEGCSSFAVQPSVWEYKGHDIGYDVSYKVEGPAELLLEHGFEDSDSDTNAADADDDDDDSTSQPVLLLNGFGVGSFHQHRLMPRLLDGDENRVVYGIDYLGQGRSWPRDCQDGQGDSEIGLRYDAEMWIDQILTFLEEVVLPKHTSADGEVRKVHLIGNSVGGHLAAHLAYIRPDLIESICLLNPTPVWGLNLPGWSGRLPAPAVPKRIGRYLFDKIRDLNTIEKYLESAYFYKEAYDQELMYQIRQCTQGNGGHAAFASILWSPPLKKSSLINMSFDECLSAIKCDVLLIFGKDDPWCKPAFAKTMLRALDKRAGDWVHRYVEIENAGHCPNHEAPQAVARIFNAWAKASDRDGDVLTLVQGDREVVVEPWGEMVMRELEGDFIPVTLIDRVATTFM